MSGHMLWENLEALTPSDEVKFVMTDRADYEWALDMIGKYRLFGKQAVHFSPAFRLLEPRQLASWMLESPALKHSLNVRLQLQIHKYIWPSVERGV